MNRLIFVFIFTSFFVFGCAKKHTRPLRKDDGQGNTPSQSTGGMGGESVGGASGESVSGGNESVGGASGESVSGGMGGHGGESGNEPIEPDFEERLIFETGPEPLRCEGSESIATDICGDVPVVIPTITQTQPNHWTMEVCSQLSNLTESSCENKMENETVIQWTAPESGYYTFLFSSTTENISVRTQCDDISSEVNCQNRNSNQPNVLGLEAQVNQVYYLVLRSFSSYSGYISPHSISIIKSPAPFSPEITSIRSDVSPNTKTLSLHIEVTDKNADVTAFLYQFFEDPNEEPLPLYHEQIVPHEYDHFTAKSPIRLFLDSMIEVQAHNFENKLTLYSFVRIPPDATHFRVQALDEAGLQSNFTTIFPIEQFTWSQNPETPEEGEPCIPSETDIPRKAFLDLYCLKAVGEPTHRWVKLHSAPQLLLPFCENFFEIESKRFHRTGSIFSHEIIIKSKYEEIKPRGETNDVSLLFSSLKQISPHRYQFQKTYFGKNVDTRRDLDLDEVNFQSYHLLLQDPFFDCLVVGFSEISEPHPIQSAGERCDPSMTHNICEVGFACLPNDDGFQCTSTQDEPLPQILSAHRSFNEKPMSPFDTHRKLGFAIDIDDPNNQLLDLQINTTRLNGQISSDNESIGLQDLSTYKQENQYFIRTQIDNGNDYGFGLLFDQRQWLVRVIDKLGRTGEWVEMPLLPTEVVAEGENCSRFVALNDCEESTFCQLNPNQYQGICTPHEPAPQIDQVQASFHIPTLSKRDQLALSQSANRKNFLLHLDLEGITHMSLGELPLEIQIVDDQDRSLLDHQWIFHLISYELFDYESLFPVDFSVEENGRFRAQWNLIIESSFLELPEPSWNSTENLSNTLSNLRIQVRLFDRHGNHSNWAESVLMATPTIEENQNCSPQVPRDVCAQNLVCARMNAQDQHQCLPIDGLPDTCPAQFQVTHLNNFLLPVNPEDPLDEASQQWLVENNFAYSGHLTHTTCDFAQIQKAFSFTAPESFDAPTLFQFELEGSYPSLSIRSSCAWAQTEIACNSYPESGYFESHTALITSVEPNQTLYLIAETNSDNSNLELKAQPYVQSQLRTNVEGHPPRAQIEDQPASGNDGEDTFEITAEVPVQLGSLKWYLSASDRFITQATLLTEEGQPLENLGVHLEYDEHFVSPDFWIDEEQKITKLLISITPEIPFENRHDIHSIELHVSEKQFALEPYPLLIEVE